MRRSEAAAMVARVEYKDSNLALGHHVFCQKPCTTEFTCPWKTQALVSGVT